MNRLRPNLIIELVVDPGRSASIITCDQTDHADLGVFAPSHIVTGQGTYQGLLRVQPS